MKKIYFSIVIFLFVNALSAQKGWKHYKFSDGAPLGLYTDLEFDNEGRLWIGALDIDNGDKPALAYFYNDSFKVIDNYEIKIVQDLLFNKDTLWVLTNTRLFSYTNDKWEKHFIDTLNNDFKNLQFGKGMAIDQKGNKWIPTYPGVLKINNKEAQLYYKQNSGIPSNDIEHVISTGLNLWMASGDGFIKFDGTNWRIMHNKNSNLKDDNTSEVAIDKQDRLWLSAVDDNLSGFSLVQSVDNFFKFDFYPCMFSFIKEIKFDSNNKIWMIAGDFNLVTFANSTFTLIDTKHFDKRTKLRTLLIDDNDNIWIGTSEGISVYNEDSATVSNREILEPKNNFVYPNPAKDFLKLNVDMKGDYEIYNIAGQLKQKGLVDGKTINTSTLEAGIYMLVVKGENEFFSTKFIKQ